LSDDKQDFCEPSDLISAETLADWAAGGCHFDSAGFKHRFNRYSEAGWFEQQDPSIVQLLNEAAVGWASASVEHRDTELYLSTHATRAGYLIGRMVLGSVDQPLRWSSDAETGAEAVDGLVQQIDFCAISAKASEGVYDLTLELADEWAAKFGLFAEDDEIGNVVFMAFDNAMTVALVEHDGALGRSA
jgi:hypothetical protein